VPVIEALPLVVVVVELTVPRVDVPETFKFASDVDAETTKELAFKAAVVVTHLEYLLYL
jgi:uncharacterized linocin/CFP29 family protein